MITFCHVYISILLTITMCRVIKILKIRFFSEYTIKHFLSLYNSRHKIINIEISDVKYLM